MLTTNHMENKAKIEICENIIGVVTNLGLSCKSCNLDINIHSNYCLNLNKEDEKQEISKRENASLHTVNNRMVMGTLASGMGPANPSVNFPHSRPFSGQVFKNIENKIGEHIINIVDKSMENGKQLEMKLKLNAKKGELWEMGKRSNI